MEDKLEVFCRQIASRSKENRRSIKALHEQNLFGNMVSVLRQEIDSLIRVIFLLSLKDLTYRNQLIENSVDGITWINKETHRRITDRDMVEIANKLNGWTRLVYQFGCAFIHLSDFHDYLARDPMTKIPDQEKQSILNYLRMYHNGPKSDNPSFREILSYIPVIFEKISGNLAYYIDDLKAGKFL